MHLRTYEGFPKAIAPGPPKTVALRDPPQFAYGRFFATLDVVVPLSHKVSCYLGKTSRSIWTGSMDHNNAFNSIGDFPTQCDPPSATDLLLN